MNAAGQTSQELLDAVVNLRFPETSNRRLQELMDLNNEGQLTDEQRRELASYVELSEEIALVRAQALRLLGRRPA